MEIDQKRVDHGTVNSGGILKSYMANSDPTYTQRFAQEDPNKEEPQKKTIVKIAIAVILLIIRSVVWINFGPYKCPYCEGWFIGKREVYRVPTDYGLKDAFICEDCYQIYKTGATSGPCDYD